MYYVMLQCNIKKNTNVQYLNQFFLGDFKGEEGRPDRMVVGFTIKNVTSAYHH